MIRYVLVCDSGHEFESWFRSSATFDDQRADGLVTCAICNSGKVGKALMAPALTRGTGLDQTIAAPDPQPTAPAMGEPERRLRAMFRAMHEHIRGTSDHVGSRFATEARSMHYGDIPHRAIYGEASPDEARALVEEGIEVCPLPPMPDERN